MIARAYRLSEPEVKRLARKGRSFVSGDFRLVYLPNRHSHHRIAFALSSKQVVNGVSRNAFRRRGYDTLLAQLTQASRAGIFCDCLINFRNSLKLDHKDHPRLARWSDEISLAFQAFASSH